MGRVEKAIESNKRKGYLKRFELLKFLETHKGLSEYEIAKKLKWSHGVVHHHLKIMEEQGVVGFKIVTENPHPKKIAYLKELNIGDVIVKEELDTGTLKALGIE